MRNFDILSYRKYSNKQILDLIYNDNYIPVASGQELNALRTTTNQKMGVGTVFEKTYTTGIDKRYIQVRNISLSDYQSGAGWVVINCSSNDLIYDGNNLKISDLKANTTSGPSALFSGAGKCVFRNMKLCNFDIRGVGTQGCLLGGSNASIVENIHVYNSYVYGGGSATSVGCIIGIVVDGGIIQNCSVYNSYCESAQYAGPIIAFVFYGTGNDLYIKNCYTVNCTAKSRRNQVGCCFGRLTATAVGTKVYADNCYSFNGTAIGDRDGNIGGFIGNVGSFTTVSNCYTNSKIILRDKTNLLFGGFCGSNIGAIINCIYDKDIANLSDTGKGEPRTTLQIIKGTPNSFILPDGNIDPDSLVANAMYSGWDATKLIWNFNNGKYPQLTRII